MSNQNQEFYVKWIAVQLHVKNVNWPEGAVKVTIGSEVEFQDEDEDYVAIGNLEWISRDSLLPHYDYYNDDPIEVTKEEYDEFVVNNPTFVDDVMSERQQNQQIIADKIKEIQQAVNDLYKLAEASFIPVAFNLGGYGVVDPAGDWQSSRC